MKRVICFSGVLIVLLSVLCVPCFASSTDSTESRIKLPYELKPLSTSISYFDDRGAEYYAEWGGIAPLEAGEYLLNNGDIAYITEQSRITASKSGIPTRSTTFQIRGTGDISSRAVDLNTAYYTNLQDDVPPLLNSYSMTFGQFIFDGTSSFGSISDNELSFDYESTSGATGGVEVVTSVRIKGFGYNNVGESYVYDETYRDTYTSPGGSTSGSYAMDSFYLANRAIEQLSPFPYQLYVEELTITHEFCDVNGEPFRITGLSDYFHINLVDDTMSYLTLANRFESLMDNHNSILDYDFFGWVQSVAVSIWEFELLPNITIGTVFSSVVGLVLVFTFIKFFAGG